MTLTNADKHSQRFMLTIYMYSSSGPPKTERLIISFGMEDRKRRSRQKLISLEAERDEKIIFSRRFFLSSNEDHQYFFRRSLFAERQTST